MKIIVDKIIGALEAQIRLALEESYNAGVLAATINTVKSVIDSDKILVPKSCLHVCVSDGKGNGLYDHEVCGVGPCGRPPNHSGPHLERHEASDAVPYHLV